MESVRLALEEPTSEAVDFVRFCYRRRRAGWPEIYDEMCAVAARGLFNGWTHEDLAQRGIAFTLFDMQALAGLTRRVIAEEDSRRRAVPAAPVVRRPLDVEPVIELAPRTVELAQRPIELAPRPVEHADEERPRLLPAIALA